MGNVRVSVWINVRVSVHSPTMHGLYEPSFSVCLYQGQPVNPDQNLDYDELIQFLCIRTLKWFSLIQIGMHVCIYWDAFPLSSINNASI